MSDNGRKAQEEGLILVVEDDPATRRLYQRVFRDCSPTAFAADGSEAFQLIDSSPAVDLAFIDYKLPSISGLEVVKKIKKCFPGAEVIVVTGLEDVQAAVQSIKAGAANFLTKPIRPKELLAIVSRNRAASSLRRENEELRRIIATAAGSREFIGTSPPARRLLATIEKIAQLDVTVLLTGETGVGKDLVARLIHAHSPRHKQPLVVADCAAISDKLIESDLFGHKRGAFTGADESRRGKFEQADGGTIFLNELSSLSLASQQKLLRAIEEGRVERLGDEEPVSINVRIIAASNESLEDKVAAGQFRSDLYYRLHKLIVEIPPLRDRRQDIPQLAKHLLERACAKYERDSLSISAAALERLSGYDWPGNIRELGNVLERAAIVASGDRIEPEDLGCPALGTVFPGSTSGTTPRGNNSLKDIERQKILDILELHGGNLARAARELGIARSTLYGKLEKYGLRRP